MNTELLNKIADIIEKTGRKHFNMQHWFQNRLTGGYSDEFLRQNAKATDKPVMAQRFACGRFMDLEDKSCRTTACIAGWALILSDTKTTFFSGFSHPAQKVLGITPEQGRKLFYVANWPDQFKRLRGRKLCTIDGTTPKLAAARIRHFIATEGKE